MNDPWGSSSTAAWASSAAPGGHDDASATTPFPSLPTPAILSLRERQPSPLHLAPPPPDAARLGGARPITPGQSHPSSQAQTPWAEGFADDPFGIANGWAVGAAGEGGLAAAVWAGTSTALRRRGSTRTSLSLSLSLSLPLSSNVNSHSPARGASPKLPPIPGREPSPDPWAKGSPVASESGWGELAASKERRYTLKKFADDDFLEGRPWARDSVEIMSQISLGGRSASVTEADDRDKHAIPKSIAEEDEDDADACRNETQNQAIAYSDKKASCSTTHSESESLEEDHGLAPDQPTAEEVLSQGQEASATLELPPSPTQPQPKPRRRVSIPYPVDLGLLEHLLPGTTAFPARPAELPAHDTCDSFGTIQESKAWYRVSRFGSMRKHDRGEDDEKYTRVSWQGSAVQGEVVKIVRRWLQETSNGRQRGRFGLGRGAGTFNWDSEEAPFSLDQIFPKKSPASPLVSGPRSAASSEAPARFSWSAASNPMAIASPNPGHRPESVNLAIASRWGISAPPRHPAPFSARERAQTQPAPVVVPQPEKEEDADEDEWGEMVSTPAAATTANSHFHPIDSGFGSWATTPVTGAGRRSEDKAASLSSRRASLSHHEPSMPPPARPSVSAPVSHVSTEVKASPPRKPVSIPSPGTLTETAEVSAADHVETDMHADYDGVARRIVDGLPDVSYILR